MTFLEHVAQDIIRRFGNNLSDISVIFPNRRASLFLNEALVRYSCKPVLAPQYYTISDLFRKLSSHTVADTIQLVCQLHDAYCKCTGSTESLDRFYPWGEILLNDFNDIDKHRLDAEKIITNVRDLHELDDISFLTEEQKLALKTFFPEYEGKNSELKQKFLNLWNNLPRIYNEFRKLLCEQSSFYEGALYRDVIDKFESNALNAKEKSVIDQSKTFIFVGFNHLLPVERKLFELLKKHNSTLYYWDYDEYYLKSEVGKEILENKFLFPNALDEDNSDIYANFSKDKDIRFISSKTNNLQARYVHDWLMENNRLEDGRDTVIVLADESLLPSVLHSLPYHNGQPLPINITIGYNLSYTTIPSQLDSMMKEKGYTNAETLLEKVHFLVDRITELGKKENIDPLEKESLFRTYTLLNRLSRLIQEGFLDITEITFRKLLTQLLQSTSVPFHGEPIEGIQIMGVLETRNLDFKNVLFLSCNEGVMPKCGVQTSFMPYFIRKAYKLSTIDNKVDIFAYYFYRLLQRCNNATIMWNSSTEGSQRGEMSRFMLQMLVESKHDIKKYALQGNVNSNIFQQSGVASIKKTEAIMQKLLRKFSDDGEKKIFSPTAFGRYLRCPKLFYLEAVAELHEYEDPEEKENDNRTFGKIFHATVQDIYKPFIGRQLTGIAIDKLNDKTIISKLVCENYAKEMNWDDSARISGLAKIRTDVITTYIRKLLDSDKKLAPFTIVDLEKYITETCKINIAGNNEFEITIGGYVDRIDKVRLEDGSEMVRIIDYKTGGKVFSPEIANVSEIFDPEKIPNHCDYYLQTFLYSMLYSSKCNPLHIPVSPVLLFIQHIGSSGQSALQFKDGTAISNIEVYRQDFMEKLKTLAEEIFNPMIDFIPQEKSCGNCPFFSLCH